jgi:Ca2+/Na+ antiporter
MNAILMMATMTSYFIIQIPAFIFDRSENGYTEQGQRENSYAGVAFFVTLSWFVFYLVHQFREGQSESKQEIEHEVELMEDLIKHGKFTILDAMDQFKEEVNTEKPGTADAASRSGVHEILLDSATIPTKSLARMKLLLKHFFHKYDLNNDNEINKVEFFLVCQDMGMHDGKVQDTLFKATDIDDNGSISCAEYTSCMIDYALKRTHDAQPPLPCRKSITSVHDLLSRDDQDVEAGGDAKEGMESDSESDDDDDAESPPEDLDHLDPKARQFWILVRSFRTMLFGTVLVVVFSDPMVDVLATIGDRLHMNPFYVSFIVAPIASNASELVAAYNYAVKKTQRSITVSLSTLQGAACMNNTFCLCVFLGMIWKRSFPWQFTAETISIIVAEVILAAYSYCRRVEKTIDAIPLFLVYPLSLALTATLEYFGMD